MADERKSFRDVIQELARDREIVNGVGNVDLPAFAEQIDGVHYETLRKAMAGERPPGVGLMEAVAAAMNIEPTGFYEYQLAKAQEQFDPKVVGVEQALDNLTIFLEARGKKPRSSRR